MIIDEINNKIKNYTSKVKFPNQLIRVEPLPIPDGSIFYVYYTYSKDKNGYE